MWQLHTRRCNLHVNVFTSSFIERDHVPVVAESDRQALELALEIAKVRDPEKARIVRIRETNTLGVSSTFRKGCGTKRSPTSAFGSSTKGNGRFKTVSCPRRLRPSPSVKFPQRRSLNRLKVARKSDKCPIDGRVRLAIIASAKCCGWQSHSAQHIVVTEVVRMGGGKSGESPALSRSGNWGRKPLGVTDLNLR